MPVRVITTGLPQVRVEDSGTPLSEGLSQAATTLLGLGPKLAQINMEKAHRDRELQLRQGQLDVENRRADQTEKYQDESLRQMGESRLAQVDERRANAAYRASEAARQANQQQIETRKGMAAGYVDIPDNQRYAPGVPGFIGRISGMATGQAPNFTLSDLSRLREANISGAAAKTANVAGKNQTAEKVATIRADATKDVSTARTSEREKELAQKNNLAVNKMADAAVAAATKKLQQSYALKGDMEGYITAKLPPEEEAAIRAKVAAEYGVAPTAGPTADPLLKALDEYSKTRK